MAQEFSISLPDDVYDLVKAMAEQEGTTVSGYLAGLAKERADVDRTSRERLARLTAKDRAADPDAYDQRREEIRQRMRAAKVAADEKKRAQNACYVLPDASVSGGGMQREVRGAGWEDIRALSYGDRL
ncbi:hypothetical protein [Nonomuraea sp. SYSU D8015]|uniref:hypothetical protein n=1 Tax=Nonomuraea sp. SYSU D8015 TaxID=2593644 RepID=UPI001660D7A4|nr:hypothetical protein [Nonomuraea sp. SYSU D8015]